MIGLQNRQTWLKKRSFRTFFLLITALFLQETSTIAAGHTTGHQVAKGCIDGQVIDSKGKGLMRVLVQTKPHTSPKWTRSDGRFTLCFRRVVHQVRGKSRVIPTRLPAGFYQVQFLKVGYYTRTLSFFYRNNMLHLKPILLKSLKQAWCISQQPKYQNRKKNGFERTCWPSGALQMERQYQNGKLHGRYRFWMPNGQLYESGFFVHGKHNGLYTRWNQQNKVVIKQQYQTQPQERVSSDQNMPRRLQTLTAKEKERIFHLMQKDKDPLKLFSQPWLAWIRAKRDGTHQIRIFTLPEQKQKYMLRIVAFGEAKQHQMTDTAWIEDAKTGQFVWKMQYKQTTQADNDPRNRMIDTYIKLQSGRYYVHFVTDASHSPQQWIAAPASYPQRYGVTVYHTKSRGYQLLLPSKHLK